MESPVAEKQKPAFWAGSLNSCAGLGIISTINMLFVIGFVGIACKQCSTKAPTKNCFGLVRGITKNRCLRRE
ncbi:hypothetical protein N5J30_15985, partial [Klebsiella michiganensis]|uniref:hypothetical protein n=1 Tax=Klebsiella michiganensis TaxID=1134687 RepID=UPI002449F763